MIPCFLHTISPSWSLFVFIHLCWYSFRFLPQIKVYANNNINWGNSLQHHTDLPLRPPLKALDIVCAMSSVMLYSNLILSPHVSFTHIRLCVSLHHTTCQDNSLPPALLSSTCIYYTCQHCCHIVTD